MAGPEGWEDLVGGRDDNFDDLQVIAPEPSERTWSGPFRAIASDNNSYFVKSLATCPLDEGASLATERIVAQAGLLIGSPVCRTSLIRIPSEIAGYEVRPGVRLQEGLAHASLAVDQAEMVRQRLGARASDDNASRHVGVYALYDWCFGADQQWLYDLEADRTIFSHDHGLYLPPAGMGSWSIVGMRGVVDVPHVLPDPTTGLSASALMETASALEAVDVASLVPILNSIPASWPVTDDELAVVGWFLHRRAASVAARLRTLVEEGAADD